MTSNQQDRTELQRRDVLVAAGAAVIGGLAASPSANLGTGIASLSTQQLVDAPGHEGDSARVVAPRGWSTYRGALNL